MWWNSTAQSDLFTARQQYDDSTQTTLMHYTDITLRISSWNGWFSEVGSPFLMGVEKRMHFECKNIPSKSVYRNVYHKIYTFTLCGFLHIEEITSFQRRNLPPTQKTCIFWRGNPLLQLLAIGTTNQFFISLRSSSAAMWSFWPCRRLSHGLFSVKKVTFAFAIKPILHCIKGHQSTSEKGVLTCFQFFKCQFWAWNDADCKTLEIHYK